MPLMDIHEVSEYLTESGVTVSVPTLRAWRLTWPDGTRKGPQPRVMTPRRLRYSRDDVARWAATAAAAAAEAEAGMDIRQLSQHLTAHGLPVAVTTLRDWRRTWLPGGARVGPRPRIGSNRRLWYAEADVAAFLAGAQPGGRVPADV